MPLEQKSKCIHGKGFLTTSEAVDQNGGDSKAKSKMEGKTVAPRIKQETIVEVNTTGTSKGGKIQSSNMVSDLAKLLDNSLKADGSNINQREEKPKSSVRFSSTEKKDDIWETIHGPVKDQRTEKDPKDKDTPSSTLWKRAVSRARALKPTRGREEKKEDKDSGKSLREKIDGVTTSIRRALSMPRSFSKSRKDKDEKF